MIYRNSRYTKTEVEGNDSLFSFKLRKRFVFNMENALVHQFNSSDRLDGLAMVYYGDPHLWWVILEANPLYRSEFEIQPGDNLVIPSKEEVMKCLM